MKLIFTMILLFAVTITFSQIKWDIYTVQIDSLYYEVHMKATIDKPWCVFSQYRTTAQIPIPTTISLISNNHVKEVVTDVHEDGDIIKPKESSEGVYYKDNVIFIKVVKLKDLKTPAIIKGTINYQLCNGSECKPPTRKEFSIVINNN